MWWIIGGIIWWIVGFLRFYFWHRKSFDFKFEDWILAIIFGFSGISGLIILWFVDTDD